MDGWEPDAIPNPCSGWDNRNVGSNGRVQGCSCARTSTDPNPAFPGIWGSLGCLMCWNEEPGCERQGQGKRLSSGIPLVVGLLSLRECGEGDPGADPHFPSGNELGMGICGVLPLFLGNLSWERGNGADPHFSSGNELGRGSMGCCPLPSGNTSWERDPGADPQFCLGNMRWERDPWGTAPFPHGM